MVWQQSASDDPPNIQSRGLLSFVILQKPAWFILDFDKLYNVYDSINAGLSFVTVISQLA